MASPSAPSVLDVALSCLRAGISVVPIKTDGSKQPAVTSWKEMQIQRIPDDVAEEQFGDDDVGIAAVCGKVSGNLEIIDFDESELFETWNAAVEKSAPGLVDRLYHAKTPGGGDHIGYRSDEIERNQKLAEAPDEDDQGRPKPRVRIETRGEGGYAMLPGSPRECHPSGRRYRHVSGPPINEVPAITPRERRILLECARSFNQWIKSSRVVHGHDGEAPRHEGKRHEGEPVEGEKRRDRPGDEFNTRAKWKDVLGPHRWTVDQRRDGVTYWRRPGKSVGASATTGHCKTPDGEELLYVFSTNAHPFESQSGYTKFTAYALLNHGGDFKAASQDLAGKGYGKTGTDSDALVQARKKIRKLLNTEAMDPAAPFEDGMVGAFATLSRRDPARWEAVRTCLKEDGVRVGHLDKLIEGRERGDTSRIPMGQPLRDQITDLFERTRSSANNVASLPAVSDLVLSWLRSTGVKFVRAGEEVWLLWRDQPYLVSDNVQFNSLMFELTGLVVKTPLGRALWEMIRCEGHRIGTDACPTWWTWTDLSNGTSYLAANPSTVLQIEEGGVQPRRNGENGIFIRFPEDVLPFEFDSGASIRRALRRLDELVIRCLPLPRSAALIATSATLASMLRGYVRTRPLQHHRGAWQAGKTTAARLTGAVLSGLDLVGHHTNASLYDLGARSPLLILDNKEAINLSREDTDVLLMGTTGVTRHKRASGADTGVVRQPIDALFAVTSIEPLPLPELQSRSWTFEAEAKFKTNKKFDDLMALATITSERPFILSGFVRMLARDVLPVINDGGLADVREELIRLGVIAWGDRTGMYLALVSTILDGICKHTGDNLGTVLQEWRALQDKVARRTAAGTNEIIRWLEVLAHIDRDEARLALPFKVQIAAGGTVTFKCTCQQLLTAFQQVARVQGTKVGWTSAEQLASRLRSDVRILRDDGWTFKRGRSRGQRIYRFRGARRHSGRPTVPMNSGKRRP